MKRGTGKHPKMTGLARALRSELGIDLPPMTAQALARGLMDSLWEWAARHTPQGNIGKYENLHIAEAAQWEGDPDAFVRVLIEKKWLDESGEHRLVIHDWWEHCEDSVHIAVARAHLFFADGKVPKLTRLAKTERAQIEEYYKQRDLGEPETCAQMRLKAHDERTTSTKTITKTIASTNQPTGGGLVGGLANALPDFPESAAVVDEHFPGSGNVAEQIVALAVAEAPDITDPELAHMLRSSWTRDQRKAAAWLTTRIPELLRTRARIQARSRGRPPGLADSPQQTDPALAHDLRARAAEMRSVGLDKAAAQLEQDALVLEQREAISKISKGVIHAVVRT